MNDYLSWNKALFEYFFISNDQNTNKGIVYLYVNDELIQRIGTSLGFSSSKSVDEFCNSIKFFSPVKENLFREIYTLSVRWYKSGMTKTPPFIGLLGFCVLAASRMEGDINNSVSSGNYYYRLRELLDSNESEGKPDYFEKTEKLWMLLKKWQKTNKTYGFTPSFPFGNLRFTGYPRSQCIIKVGEKEFLNDFFYWAGYQHQIEINIDQLQTDLEIFLSSRSGHRLSKMYSMKSLSYKDILVKMIYSEINTLIKNHVSITKPTKGKISKLRSQNINYEENKVKLRLCFEYDGGLFDKSAKLSFIGKYTDIDYSEEQFTNSLYNNGIFQKYICSQINLTKNHFFEISQHGIKLEFDGSDIFIFRLGVDLELNGWISRSNFRANQEHLILYNDSISGEINEWLDSNNLSAKNKLKKGHSEKWTSLRVYIPEYIILTKIFDNKFKFSSKITLRLTNGLKVAHNTWLLKYPPNLLVSAPKHSVISLNGKEKFCLVEGVENLELNQVIREPGSYLVDISTVNKSFTLIESSNIQFESKSLEYIEHISSGNKVQFFGGFIECEDDQYTLSYVKDSNNLIRTMINGVQKEIAVSQEHIMAQPYVREFNSLNIPTKQFLDPMDYRPIDFFLEYLSIRKKGSWKYFLKGIEVCFGKEKLHLIAYSVKEILSAFGHVTFIYKQYQFSWYINPTCLVLLPSKDVTGFVTGYRTKKIIESLLDNEDINVFLKIRKPLSEHEPLGFYIVCNSITDLGEFCRNNQLLSNDLSEYFSHHLLKILPSIKELLYSCDSFNIDIVRNWTKSCWNLDNNNWIDSLTPYEYTKFENKYGIKLYLYAEKQEYKLVDPKLGKVLLASNHNRKFFIYKNYQFSILYQYRLPDLYEQVLLSCSGCYPEVEQSYRVYRNIPIEVAAVLIKKLGFD